MARYRLLRVGLGVGALVMFLLLTSPARLPVFLLPLPFVITGVTFYHVWMFLGTLYAPSRLRSKQFRYAGATIGGVLLIFMALSSLGELTPRDCVTVVLFAAVGYFYSVRSS